MSQGIITTDRYQYLPKVLYPFNSINFRNLVPDYNHCNAFNPYAAVGYAAQD